MATHNISTGNFLPRQGMGAVFLVLTEGEAFFTWNTARAAAFIEFIVTCNTKIKRIARSSKYQLTNTGMRVKVIEIKIVYIYM